MHCSTFSRVACPVSMSVSTLCQYQPLSSDGYWRLCTYPHVPAYNKSVIQSGPFSNFFIEHWFLLFTDSLSPQSSVMNSIHQISSVLSWAKTWKTLFSVRFYWNFLPKFVLPKLWTKNFDPILSRIGGEGSTPAWMFNCG